MAAPGLRARRGGRPGGGGLRPPPRPIVPGPAGKAQGGGAVAPPGPLPASGTAPSGERELGRRLQVFRLLPGLGEIRSHEYLRRQ